MVHLASFPLLVSSPVLEITLNYELTQQQRYSGAPERNSELNYGSGHLGGGGQTVESEDIRPEIAHESKKCHLEQSLATLRPSLTWLLRLPQHPQVSPHICAPCWWLRRPAPPGDASVLPSVC